MIDEYYSRHPICIIIIRGDFNIFKENLLTATNLDLIESHSTRKNRHLDKTFKKKGIEHEARTSSTYLESDHLGVMYRRRQQTVTRSKVEHRDTSHCNRWNLGLKLDAVKLLHFSDDPNVTYALLVVFLLNYWMNYVEGKIPNFSIKTKIK